MKRIYNNLYKEYIYPKNMQAFIKKIILLLFLVTILILIIVYLINKIITINMPLIIVFYCLAIFLIVFLMSFFLPSIIKEIISIMQYPFKGLQILGKIILDYEKIQLFLGKNIIRSIK